MKRITVAAFFIFTCVILPAHPAQKTVIAILDLKPIGVSKMMAQTVASMIRSDLVNMGKFYVVERSQIDEILKEQGFQRTGCTEQSCAIKVGRLVSARKIMIGELHKLGSVLIITVRIVDVEKGISEYAAREKSRSVEVLDEAITRITAKLSERIVFISEVPSEGPSISKQVRGEFLFGKTWKSEGYWKPSAFKPSLDWFSGIVYVKFIDGNKLLLSTDGEKFRTQNDYEWNVDEKGILEIVYTFTDSWGPAFFTENYQHKQNNTLKGKRFIYSHHINFSSDVTLSVVRK
jgi:TolB-like protein